MNTATVTSKRSGQVYQVLPFPADTDAEDTIGKVWVRDAEGYEFSVKESQVIEGGEFAEAKAPEPQPENRSNWADAIVAVNEEKERKENRRSYYLRTGR